MLEKSYTVNCLEGFAKKILRQKKITHNPHSSSQKANGRPLKK